MPIAGEAVATVGTIIAGVVAFQHVLFMILEMFLWRGKARAVFRTSKSLADQSAGLAANQVRHAPTAAASSPYMHIEQQHTLIHVPLVGTIWYHNPRVCARVLFGGQCRATTMACCQSAWCMAWPPTTRKSCVVYGCPPLCCVLCVVCLCAAINQTSSAPTALHMAGDRATPPPTHTHTAASS